MFLVDEISIFFITYHRGEQGASPVLTDSLIKILAFK